MIDENPREPAREERRPPKPHSAKPRAHWRPEGPGGDARPKKPFVRKPGAGKPGNPPPRKKGKPTRGQGG